MFTKSVISLKDLTDYLDVSKTAITNAMKRGELKGWKLGRLWKFDRKDVEQFLQQQRENPNA